MSLTFKEKELVFVGASVAAGCKPCTNFHFKKVKEAGASDGEIKKAIADAACVRNNSKEVMEAHSLKHLGIQKKVDDCGCAGNPDRVKELVSVGAAFAVNCTTNLEKHLSEARKAGVNDDEIKEVFKATLFIKGQAASHVDKIANSIGFSTTTVTEKKEDGGCGCSEEIPEPKKEETKPKQDSKSEPGCEPECGCHS